eukprot:128755_1
MGNAQDGDYEDETWDVTITMREIRDETTSEYYGTKIDCNYEEKKIIFKHDKKNVFVLKQNEFTMKRVGTTVNIKDVSNDNSIAIHCKDIKPAKYWYSKFKGLSK